MPSGESDSARLCAIAELSEPKMLGVHVLYPVRPVLGSIQPHYSMSSWQKKDMSQASTEILLRGNLLLSIHCREHLFDDTAVCFYSANLPMAFSCCNIQADPFLLKEFMPSVIKVLSC